MIPRPQSPQVGPPPQARGRLSLFGLDLATRAFRALWRDRGYVVGALGALALAVGANTAIYALLGALWVHPLRVDAPDRVVMLYDSRRGGGEYRFWIDVEDLRRSATLVTHVAAELSRAPALGDRRPRLTWPDQSALTLTAVTSGWFEALGVPVRGRTFTAADDDRGAAAALILSDRFWRRHLHADASVLGRDVNLGAVRAQVVGIAAPGFDGPRIGDMFDGWLSFGAVPEASDPHLGLDHAVITLYGRLRDEVSLADASAEVQRLMAGGTLHYRWRTLADGAYPLEAQGKREDDHRLLLLLSLMGALLLVIACVNVGGLELARVTRRKRDLAVHVALGASRGRVLGDAALETLAKVAVAGPLAVLVAWWCLGSLQAFFLPSGTAIASVQATLGLSALGVACGLTAVTILLASMVPLARLSRSDPAGLLRSRSVNAGRQPGGRSLLLSAQVALSLVLLVGALLLIRTVRNALTVDLGFAQDQTASVFVQPRVAQFRQDLFAARAAAFQQFRAQLADQPRVVSAAFGGLPIGSAFPIPATDRDGSFVRLQVGPDYGHVVGLQFLAGRDLAPEDVTARDPRPVVVSQSFVAARWPGATAVGQTFVAAGGSAPASGSLPAETLEIVGIVRDAYRTGFRARPTPTVFEAATPEPGRDLAHTAAEFVVRLRGPADAAVPELQRLSQQAFPSATQLAVHTASRLIADQTHAERLGASLFGAFGVLALLLVSVGTYSLVSFVVVSRTGELAIRAALGASPGRLRMLVGWVGLQPLLVGGVFGSVASFWSSRYLSTYLFGVGRNDVATYTVAVTILVVSVVAACSRPARRASRLNLTQVMRAE